jgi:D-beta-D-heptose 7-phosphate kinase / D-beta-D-heptose 1-phosphate adenosyltransferase
MSKIVFKPSESAKVLVVGDIILDQYIYGETNRISPEAPVPVVRVKDTEERPGGAANVAVNVSSLGVAVQLLGITGKDEASERLEHILTDKGVDCHFIYQEKYPTITKRRVLSQHQQLIRLDYEETSNKLNGEELLDKYLQLIDSVDVVILSDYAKGSLSQVETFIKYANDKNVTILVDPKATDFTCYSHANVLTPNQKELEVVVGECKSNEDLIVKGTELCKHLRLDALLVTRGEKGMTLLRETEKPLHLKAETHEVYDVTGAGDTVIAVLGAAMACSSRLEEATALANVAAGLVVEKLGAATVTVDEINSNKGASNGVLDKKTALQAINQAKRNGEQIVMTNGCFDILHAGHINYLKKAKALGDRLIVAVNDDESVKKLKGDSRPVNSIDNRVIVLSALACIDWVVIFSEDTPEDLIALFEPDILVKGGDYKEEEIAGATFVRNSGGDVVILPFEEGCSTSLILEKIKENI